jgi:hypothetical protein
MPAAGAATGRKPRQDQIVRDAAGAGTHRTDKRNVGEEYAESHDPARPVVVDFAEVVEHDTDAVVF